MATQPVNPRPSNRTFCTVDISTEADGLSTPVNITGLCLCSVQMSTDWTNANIGFQASLNGSTSYYPVYNTDGNHLTYPTSANRIIQFDPGTWIGVQNIRVVSETSAGVAVAQAATREIILGLADALRNS